MHESVTLWKSVQDTVVSWPLTWENLSGLVRVGARGFAGTQMENEELYVWVGKFGIDMAETTLERVHVQVPGLESGREIRERNRDKNFDWVDGGVSV